MTKNIKALIVDDSESMRQIIVTVLNDAGISVTAVENGEEALVAAQTNQFDIVITDINMPKMDGIALTCQLRTLPAYKFVPILTLSATGTAETKNKGRSAGATGWLVKPFSGERLLAVINKLISNPA